MISSSVKWLRDMRERVGLRQDELAARAGIHQTALSRLESGERKLNRAQAEKLAPLLQVSADDLMRLKEANDEQNKAPPNKRGLDHDYKLPISYVSCVGLVGAGWVDTADPFQLDDDIQIPLVPGAYADMEQFAFRVVGNSMNAARIWDGDYVVCVPYWLARAGLATNDYVVIERHRGQLVERTVRQVVLGKTHIEFWPRSTDVRWQKPTVVLQRDMSATKLNEDDDTRVVVVGLVIWRGAPL